MGGLFHLFYFNQGNMARRLFTHKRHGGLEAPRNSLELQVDKSQSYCAAGDIPTYSYQVEEECSEDSCHQNEASMKRLINKEISKRPTARQNAPNIVARLMGMDMDMLPSDEKPATQPIEKNTRISKMDKSGKGSVGKGHSNSNSLSQMELSSHDYNKDDDDAWSSGELGKPRPREHPQEEELQKFKKEFEAWQAARFKECSKVGELGSIHKQLLAEEEASKGKRELYANSRKGSEEAMEPNKDPILKGGLHERGEIQHCGVKRELYFSDHKRSIPLRSRTLSRDFEESHVICSDQKLGTTSTPTRIVVLKPCPDRIYSKEEYWTGSSDMLEEKGSIEDFLEEVKERLKCELQGETLKRGTVVRGTEMETPFNENPSDPRKIARHIANQVRESVTRDLGMNLLRSESTRSYRSEIQFNEPGSPEFINRHTRRFWSERLRNVIRKETHMDIPIVSVGSSRVSVLDFERERLSQVKDKLKARNEVSYWEIVQDEQEMQTKSFRYGPDDEEVSDKELSPRNLIRSLSAPVSGTSFGKLLLEDRHVLTGAHIRRKHEGTEHLSEDVKKQKKEKFNFKEKVSHFRYSFALGGKLFGRKLQSVEESHSIQQYNRKDIMSGPTVIMNLHKRHENSTEVPPSPASVCSSAHEEFWRQADYPSLVSTPDVISGEDSTFPQVFREISSNLSELRKQLNQLESDRSEETLTPIQVPVEPEMAVLEDHGESYIRDLLVASGLYHGSFDKSISRYDPFAKPVSNSAFQEVEESLAKLANDDETFIKGSNERKGHHKMLFDLLNEALSIVLGPPMTVSRFRKKIIDSSMLPPLQGRKLLNSVWEIIRRYLYPPSDRSYHSLDSMVGRDLESTPWFGLMDDEMNTIGREIECLITGDLVGDIVKDLQLR